MGEILQEIRDELRHLTVDCMSNSPSDTGGDSDSDDSIVSSKSSNNSDIVDSGSDSDHGIMIPGNVDQMESESSISSPSSTQKQ